MAYRSTFPSEIHGLTDQALSILRAQLSEPFRQVLADLQIDSVTDTLLQSIYLPLAAALCFISSQQLKHVLSLDKQASSWCS